MIAFRKSAVVALVAAAVAIGVILLAAWRLWDARMASETPPVEARSGGGQPASGPTGQGSAASPQTSVAPSGAPTAPDRRVAESAPGGAPSPSALPDPATREQAEAKPATPAQQPEPPTPGEAPAGAVKPSFDIVRIEPSGEAVVAGRAAPRSRVALLVAGERYGEAVADTKGEFVILPRSLPPGDHVLSLSADTGSTGAVTSDQTVAVAVPAREGGDVVAALVAPGQPTVVLSETPKPSPQAPASAPAAKAQPGTPPAAAAAGAAGEMLIRSVEAQQGGALFVSGKASPRAELRLYLNDSFVASVAAGDDGKWSVKIQRGMSSGAYRVRADHVGADGKAIARVEAPFDYPVAIAAATSAPPPIVARLGDEQPVKAGEAAPGVKPSQDVAGAPTPSPSTSEADAGGGPSSTASPTHAVVEELRTAKVERGDSLWRISRTIYGEGMRYTQIYDANTSQIRDPDLIYPGQVLVVPKQQGGAP